MTEADISILEQMLELGIPPKVSDGKALIDEVRRLNGVIDSLKDQMKHLSVPTWNEMQDAKRSI